MKKRIFSIVLAFFLLVSCNGQPNKAVENIVAAEFAKKINETTNAQILDVRTPEEFASEHIENATNSDWLSDDFANNLKNLDPSKPVFVYCKVGARSAKAAVRMSELGFQKVYQLDGGILKWNAAGYAKADGKTTGMSSEEYAKLLNSDKKILIDFYAKWCAPCKKMTPYILEIQKNRANDVVVIRLDADEHKTLVREMKIDALPTLILYQNKEVKWKHSGYISEEDLIKKLQ